MPPPPRRRPPNSPGRGAPPGKPANQRGIVVLWCLVGVLVLAIVGATTWWFVDGRWSTVPDVAGRDGEAAQQLLLDNDLQAEVKLVPHDDIETGMAIGTEPADGQDVLRGESVTLLVSSGKPKVPAVRPGTSVEAAEQILRAAQLQPGRDDGLNTFSDAVEKGKVIRFEPSSGTPVKLGQRIEVVVSKGPEPKPIPDLRGKTRDEAFAELTSLGYKPVDRQQDFDDDVEGGRVIRTEPAAGELPGPGNEVGVVVSNAVTVPDVGGQNAEQATQTLTGFGLEVDVQAFGGTGRVFGQNPGPGTRVRSGSKVVVFTLP